MALYALLLDGRIKRDGTFGGQGVVTAEMEILLQVCMFNVDGG